MNNIISSWENILNESQKLGMPIGKRRAILREYLQTLILSELYAQKESRHLSFIGGTSLRLLRGLDRFSEDLDFDNLGGDDKQIEKIFGKISKNLDQLNIENEFQMSTLNSGIGHGSIRFPNLLKELKVSTDPREKVRIDIDYTTPLKKRNIETVLHAKYGYAANILTNRLDTITMQKIDAFMNRIDPKGRDIYDVCWLLSRNNMPDLNSSLNKYENYKALSKAVIERYNSLIDNLPQMKRSLEPFLFNSKGLNMVDNFPALIETKLK